MLEAFNKSLHQHMHFYKVFLFSCSVTNVADSGAFGPSVLSFIHGAVDPHVIAMKSANGAVDPHMIAMKSANDPKRRCVGSEKEKLLRDRVTNVSCHVTSLLDSFGSRQDLLYEVRKWSEAEVRWIRKGRTLARWSHQHFVLCNFFAGQFWFAKRLARVLCYVIDHGRCS